VAGSTQTEDDDHFWLLATRLNAGRVVPFLGAGANLCGRPPGAGFERGRYLPSGAELAHLLAEKIRYPVDEESEPDLLRVSQYVDAVLGERALYEYLRDTFDADYPPTALHHVLASIPANLRRNGSPGLLVLTTNYDDAMERALEARGEEYELLWYEAKRGEAHGRFLRRTPGGPEVIDKPNEYDMLGQGNQTIIVKLHGAVDRQSSEGDSYVITEDNYIDYLAGTDIARQLPVTISQRLNFDHFLFLGYSLRDWNLRVVLSRIWGAQSLGVQSWAIQREQKSAQLNRIEQQLWTARGAVEVRYALLDEYAERLRDSLAQLKPQQAAP
jgi:hypothetical protein